MGWGVGWTSRYFAGLGHWLTSCDVLAQCIELVTKLNLYLNYKK